MSQHSSSSDTAGAGRTNESQGATDDRQAAGGRTVPTYLADLLDERDCRALSETMFLAEEAPDLYRVRTASGGDYRVDTREPACTCPDFQYREARCKHIRRVELESGTRDAGEMSNAVSLALSRVDERIADLAARRAELVSLQSAAEAFDSR